MYLLTSSPERPGGPIGPSSPWKQMAQTSAQLMFNDKRQKCSPSQVKPCAVQPVMSLVRCGLLTSVPGSPRGPGKPLTPGFP